MPETSIAQQLMMNNLSMTSQVMQGAFDAVSNISNMQKSDSGNGIANLTVTNSLGKLAYAVEGDSKYNEKIDSNADGIITFNEYVKYVTENMSSKVNVLKTSTTYTFGEDSQTGLLKFSVSNIGKVMSAYLNNSVQLPIGFVESEA